MYNLTVIAGILVSLLYTELTGYSAGLILPGYLALNLHSPLRLFWTLLIASVCVLLCRLLSNVMILYGRRRFALLILLTFFLGMALKRLHFLDISMIGVLIPGILAREIDRQGFPAALISLLITTGFTALLMVLTGSPLLI